MCFAASFIHVLCVSFFCLRTQVPRRRRIIETYTATTYTLAPEAVLDHFMGVVDDAISTTEAHLPGYVKEYIRRQVDQARAKVQQYGNR